MDIITSRDNAGVKYACTLRDSEKQRAAEGLFFAEGPKLCLELAKSCTPRTAYATEAAMEKTPALESLRLTWPKSWRAPRRARACLCCLNSPRPR